MNCWQVNTKLKSSETERDALKRAMETEIKSRKELEGYPPNSIVREKIY